MNREDFPMLDQDIVYFDNGATTLKPKCVIDSICRYYNEHTSNIHRGDYKSAVITNELYDNTRIIVKDFINCNSSNEVVFSYGTTHSINMVVFGYMKKHLKKGDEVLLTLSEHASNVLPWIILSKEIGIVIKYIDLDDNNELKIDNVKKAITKKTKVISIAHISNVIGDVRDIESIGKICKEKNIIFNVDGAQSVPHMKVDFKKCNIDFLSFSGHKMCGPTGVGVLVGRLELLEEMDPANVGGGMNATFDSDGNCEYKSIPTRFEAGTPPISEVIALGETIKYLESIGMDNIHKHEVKLKKYLLDKLKDIDGITIYNKDIDSGTVAFNLEDVFAQDTAVYLNNYHICVRAGNHCAKILKEDIDVKNTCRISFYLYNNYEDIDRLIEVLKNKDNLYKEIL